MNAYGSPCSGPEDLELTPYPRDRYDSDLSSFFESGEAYGTMLDDQWEPFMGPRPTARDIRQRRIGSPAAPLELGKRSPERTESRLARCALGKRSPERTDSRLARGAMAPLEQQDSAKQPKRQALAEPPPDSKVMKRP